MTESKKEWIEIKHTGGGVSKFMLYEVENNRLTKCHASMKAKKTSNLPYLVRGMLFRWSSFKA